MTKLTTVFVLGCAIVAGVGVVLLLTTDRSRRNLKLEQQVERINQAQTVDDLRPILLEIVRKQRHDYR
jgi:hypothetical protein